jgi:SAM-dependent methyltransferase
MATNYSFYGKINSRRYDTGDNRHNILAYYLKLWEKAGKPQPVLEPMCGTGFFLIPFLDAGADIDGLDSSPYMLEICRDKAHQKNYYPTLHEQFLENMALPRKYGFIFIPDRSFGHLYDKTAAQETLAKLAASLLPNGLLVLDIKTPPKTDEFGRPGETEHWVEDLPTGYTLFGTSLWSEKENGRIIRNTNKYEIFENGELITTELFDYHERFYDVDEFEVMLHKAGFTDIQTASAYDDSRRPAKHDTIVFKANTYISTNQSR